MTSSDISQELCERVREAATNRTPLCIRGGDTKAFYGREPSGEPLDVAGHRGILSYQPTELVISARAGTPLEEIEQALDERGQMLPFEPPHFGPVSTLGGAIASGLSGPGRPWRGAPRDLVLGTKLVDGKGRILSFGGQVMKNVAGYDLSRLMAGAMGCLGVLLEVSLKVLPKPAREFGLRVPLARTDALSLMRSLARKPLSITGACFFDNELQLRLAGNESALAELKSITGGEIHEDHNRFWPALRDHQLDFFQDPTPLWRLSVPPATPELELEGSWLLDWGGAQRWLKSQETGHRIRDAVAAAEGHAVLFRDGDRSGKVFHPLPSVVAALHRGLKQVFDPDGILNPGRMYCEW